jgi:hypothetical protein
MGCKKALKALLWVAISVALVVGYYGASILSRFALGYLVVPLLAVWFITWFIIIVFIIVEMLRKRKR